jgi:hypothetical protein
MSREDAFVLRWSMVLGADALLLLYCIYLRWRIKRLAAYRRLTPGAEKT